MIYIIWGYNIYSRLFEDTLLHNTIVDVTSDENFEKIKKVIDEF